MPGNSQAAFGGGPGEKGWQQHLACGLSYFALAFTGPKDEAEAIKQRLRTFLREELKLQLSEEKTLITHTGQRCYLSELRNHHDAKRYQTTPKART